MTTARKGLTLGDLGRAVGRGLLMGGVLGLSWAGSACYVQGSLQDFSEFFVQGLLIGLLALPVGLLELHALRRGARSWHVAPCVLLLGFAWQILVPLQARYANTMLETGSAAAALEGVRGLLSNTIIWLSWGRALIALAFTAPFVIATSARVQRYTLPWQLFYSFVGGGVLACSALYLRAECFFPPGLSKFNWFDLPRLALCGAAALSLPVVSALVDRLAARFSGSEQPAPPSTNTPLIRVGAAVAVGVAALIGGKLHESHELNTRAARQQKAARTAASEAEVLKARLKAGELVHEDLVLAAHLGDPGARAALGDAAPKEVKRMRAWVKGIERYGGREAMLRTAIAAGHLVVPLYERKRPEDLAPRQALEAAVNQLLSPSKANRRAVEAAKAAAIQPGPRDSKVLRWAPETACAVAGATTSKFTSDVFSALTYAEFATHEYSVRRAIRRELVPWVLRRSDPLAVPQQ